MLRPFAAILALLIVGGLAAAAVLTAAAPDRVAVVIPDPIERDLSDILERDTLVALTSYNSTSYFLYRGEPFGFEYELLRDFAEDQGIVFQMRVVPRDSLLYYLNTGAGDVAAARLEPVEEDTSAFGFTANLYETAPVIVQQEAPFDSSDVAQAGADSLMDEAIPEALAEHLSPGDEQARPLRIRARLVQRPADLAGEEVFVPSESPNINRLVEIQNRITGDIQVVVVDTTSETLIRQVAVGNIQLTVAQENVARLEESYYDNLLIRPAIAGPQGVAWGVRDNAPELLTALNEWILENRDSNRWRQLYRKYFVDRQGYRERLETGYLTGRTGVLSDYDALLKRYAPSIGWDWRLLASQMYQESRFKPNARSWAGAMGLLQLMPATAREVDVRNPYDPEENVAGGVRYLDWLNETYWEEEIPDPEERTKFILASYNVGSGHVFDAQRLTEKHGGDPRLWEDVAYWLLQKSKAEVYNDPVVKYGYARGLEPVQYVTHILERYNHYQQFVDGVEGADAVPAIEPPDA